MLRRFLLWAALLAAVSIGAAEQKDAAKQPQERKPALEYEKFRRGREIDIRMDEKRQAIRSQLEQLLEIERDEKERPQLLFRLGENYFEEAMAIFNKAQKRDEELARDPTNERLRREIEEYKKKAREEEIKWRSQAVDMYKKIIDEYPNYPGRDQVLFYLAYTLWDMDRKEESLRFYRSLIVNYPNSKFVPDAYLAFGEFYFDQAKLDKALEAYKKAAEYKEAEIYPYAIYKQGWCYYNLHDYEKAKDMFKQVIYLADMEEGTTGKRIEIRKEALKDFTLTYSHEGSASDAPNVFKKLAPKEAWDTLVSLPGMYFGSGQDKKAILLYSWLIKEAGCSVDVPFFQGRVVDCASRVGNKRYTVTQVRLLIDLFKKIRECVKNPTDSQKQRLKEAEELAELTLRKLSSQWYKEAKETKQEETFEYAQEMFGDYLALFPESPDAYDMRFAYAELLFHRLQRYEQAAVEYSKVVQHDLEWLQKNKKFPEKGTKDKAGRSAPGTYLCDASYKSILAHRELMKKSSKEDKKEREAQKSKAADKNAPLVIPKGKKRFIQAAEIYLDHCPQDQDRCSVKYDIAKTYYDHNYFDQAVKRFDEVVAECTEQDLAEYAANLTLDTFNIKQDFESLDKYARKYYANKTLMKNDKLREYLEKLIPDVAFKRIETMEEKPDMKKLSPNQRFQQIGKAYIRFAKEFAKHERADDAVFNAAVMFERAERLDLARKARELLIRDYPTSELVPGTIFNLAENHERMTQFGEAARLYEQYASTYKKMKGLGKAEVKPIKGKKEKKPAEKKPVKKEKEERFVGNQRTWNSEDAEAALINAGIYREALRQYDQAVRDRLEYLDLFPESPEAPAVQYSLGLLYEKTGKLAKAVEAFDAYAAKYIGKNTDKAIAAHMKKALLLQKLKRQKEAQKEMETTLSLFRTWSKKNKNLIEAAEAAAHAEFILGEGVYQDYISYRFTTTDAKKLKQQLEEKTKRLQKVVKLYTEIAKYKQPEWAIASLYKLGRAYENFAETYYKAPLPTGLTEKQKDIYQSMLREQGQPWEDKAVAHFEAAIKKGSELGFYSRYTQQALAKLQHYRPAEYPREDLGFSLSVVADTAIRSPLLVATWEDIKQKPELLQNEPPLQMIRVGGEEKESATPEQPATQPQAAASEPAESKPAESKPEAQPQAGKEEEPKTLPDPASEKGAEPVDEFE